MTTPPPDSRTSDALFLWVMHRFAEVFGDHAVLNGGMALRLLDCPRTTTDIDYVFVPYRSKRELQGPIEAVLRELPGAAVDCRIHRRMLRASLRLGDAAVQVEVSVSEEEATVPVSTGDFARAQGRPARVLRMMRPDVALAHKLAAWNERRLLRDLYDVWFLSYRLGAMPDPMVLGARLRRVESRLPGLRGVDSMTVDQLAAALRAAAGALDARALKQELGPLLPPAELPGLGLRLASATRAMADALAWRE